MNTTPATLHYQNEEYKMTNTPQHCVDCSDGAYERIVIDYKATDPNGVEITIPRVEILRCQSCNSELVPAKSSRHISETIAHANDQLTPSQLYGLMERYNLNQKEISNFCGFGEKTFHRWLKGTQTVSRSMGTYLRILVEFPEVFAWVQNRGWRTPSTVQTARNQAPLVEADTFPALYKRGVSTSEYTLEHNPAQTFERIAIS